LFDRESVSWRVDRETVVLAGGTCALLMQIAHPAVAAAVDAHSDFRTDPFARLRRTLGASWAIVFGDLPTAEQAIDRINQIHAAVRGFVPETASPYRALDPPLLLWVHATLVDTALRMHDRFVAPLTRAEQNAYTREAASVAIRLGVPKAMIPSTAADLRYWMGDQIDSGEVRVSGTARSLAPWILYPTSFPPRWLWDVAHLASMSVLHPGIRRQYGFGWSRRRERGVERLAAASRWVVPRLPSAIRHVPASR
jgi:uncharacterized protein (DUF2236 family)